MRRFFMGAVLLMIEFLMQRTARMQSYIIPDYFDFGLKHFPCWK
jgi:hypothetical protein